MNERNTRRNVEQSRSGKVSIPVGPEGALKPTEWKAVCSIGNSGESGSKARSVRIRVGKGDDTQPLFQASLVAGVWWTPDDDYTAWTGSVHPYCGVLRFEYGYQGMQREIFTDMRSGEYQIPPCEFLRVTAARYTPAVSQGGEFPYTVDTTPYVVEGEIADDVATDFSPMLFTAPSYWGDADAGDYLKIAAPPGAYAFDVYPDLSTGGDSFPDPPDGGAFYTRNPASIRDLVNGIWLPPSSPIPLIESYVEIAVGDNPTLRNCSIVFFVR